MIARTVAAAPGHAECRRVADGARRLAVVPAEEAKPRDLAELCEQFVLVCESAVDPLEISSALEFDGLNDQAVRELYGVSDVFALAEEMYRRVPRRPAEPEPVADPWQISKLRSALHGLIYGLPAVCFPAAAGLLSGPGVLRALVVALLSSWALSQGLAYLGYARLGRSGAAQAARVLLAGMTAGAGAVGLVMALTALAGRVHLPALVFGFGLGAYMLGATVLMVLGAERAAPRRPGARRAGFRRVPGPGAAARIWSTRSGEPWPPRRRWPLAWPRGGPAANWLLRPAPRQARRDTGARGQADHGGGAARRAAERRVRAGRRRAAGVPRRGGPDRPAGSQHRRAARLAAAGPEHGRGGVDARLVPAADATAAAGHAGTVRPSPAGPGWRCSPRCCSI